MDFSRLTVVFLREPPGAPDLPEAEGAALQQQHLGYLASMRAAGHMVTAGPFQDRFDASLRGMCLYRTDLGRTRELANADPAVLAGQLVVEVVTWMFPASELRLD